MLGWVFGLVLVRYLWGGGHVRDVIVSILGSLLAVYVSVYGFADEK